MAATGALAATNHHMLILRRHAQDIMAGLSNVASVLFNTRVAATLMPCLRTGMARSMWVSGKSTVSTGVNATVEMYLATLTATLTAPDKSINGVATTGVCGQLAVLAVAAVADSRKKKESSLNNKLQKRNWLCKTQVTSHNDDNDNITIRNKDLHITLI